MNVSLRKLTPEYFALHVQWRNANKQYFTPQPDWTVEGQERWYASSYLKSPAFHLFIVMAAERPAGVLAFNAQTREIGPVLLGEEDLRRQGIMTQAMRQLYAVFGPGLYWLRVVEGNHQAIALYAKDGFSREGAAPGDPEGQVRMSRHVTA